MAPDPIAFIAEEVEIDARGPVATGLFAGSVQTEDGGIEDAIDDWVSLAEALSWSRERADRVLVRLAGEGYYSAGRIPEDEPPLDETRRLGRRRPAGWEFLDRTDTEQPISWDVVVAIGLRPFGPIADAADRWHEALDRMGHDVVELSTAGITSPVPAGGGWVSYASSPIAVLRLRAAGYDRALAAAIAAATDAAAASVWEPVPEFSAHYAFPTGSEAALRNAHVDANGILF